MKELGNINSATWDFIREYSSAHVKDLAFKSDKYPEVDFKFALEQIEGRQKAVQKLPYWASVDGIVYPPHISMEQCSSEITARYKASLVDRLLTDLHSMVDLTGGFGVDFSYIAQSFESATYVEQQSHLCRNAIHNFKCLQLDQAHVVCADSVEYLRQLSPVNLIFLDPARRDRHGARVFGIEDCSPNVVEIEETLLAKADFVIVKLSPMLDWHDAVRKLKHTIEVHIISVGNECKELLLVMSAKREKPLKIYCINDDTDFVYTESETGDCRYDKVDMASYLYEPNSSIMKAGCFDVLSKRFPITAVGKNSHLYVSDSVVEEFPGRKFVIEAVTTMNKKELRKTLAGISKANIAVRNFPMDVATLRKRLKIKDGGDVYIFATTNSDGEHILYVTKKLFLNL